MIIRLIATLSLILSFLFFAPPAQAAACEPGQGVTVVVQTPGSTQVRCVTGQPSSGLQALDDAKFAHAPEPRNPGTVCRIDGYPADWDCWANPPKFWHYWHAAPGGNWVLSGQGAGNRTPVAGGTEGWRFGTDQPPSVPPVAAPAPTKKPQPQPNNADRRTRPVKPQASNPGKEPAPSKPGKSVSKPQPGSDAPKSANDAGEAELSPDASQNIDVDKQRDKQQRKKSKQAKKTKTANKKAANNPDHAGVDSSGERSLDADDEAVTSADLVGASATADDDGGLSWSVAVGLIAMVGAIGAGVGLRRRRG